MFRAFRAVCMSVFRAWGSLRVFEDGAAHRAGVAATDVPWLAGDA